MLVLLLRGFLAIYLKPDWVVSSLGARRNHHPGYHEINDSNPEGLPVLYRSTLCELINIHFHTYISAMLLGAPIVAGLNLTIFK